MSTLGRSASGDAFARPNGWAPMCATYWLRPVAIGARQPTSEPAIQPTTHPANQPSSQPANHASQPISVQLTSQPATCKTFHMCHSGATIRAGPDVRDPLQTSSICRPVALWVGTRSPCRLLMLGLTLLCHRQVHTSPPANQPNQPISQPANDPASQPSNQPTTPKAMMARRSGTVMAMMTASTPVKCTRSAPCSTCPRV
eukprot:3102812-Pyramimonas_sp.AAC.1